MIYCVFGKPVLAGIPEVEIISRLGKATLAQHLLKDGGLFRLSFTHEKYGLWSHVVTWFDRERAICE